ncbi:squalene synthase [Mycena floridula]|nr:squalene synthase [Mycena floridula]
MGFVSALLLLITHPLEFRTLLQFKLYHDFRHDFEKEQIDRASMKRCWEFLDLTSRSFAAVVKEVEGDLARTICLFYLVLRALDTIEDDMTLPDTLKQPLLREFHKNSVTPGWTFNGSGPNEKDRQLLVEYDTVITELDFLLPEYKEIIIDITRKMATGMADYAAKKTLALETIEEYDLYCHYVAGVVGEGLSRIFSASKKEAPWLGSQLELSNSMGLLLQKTNIIRDYREDTDDKRYFWPREIWARHGFAAQRDIHAAVDGRATWVQSAMVLDAMRHCVDSLDYLHILKNQSVFIFCAIPATMAIATLELCFMNPLMFQRNIKIRKAEAAALIMRSTNTREVAYIFRSFVRKIHAKAVPEDPYFLRISIACGKVEQWCEHHYPSFLQLTSSGALKQSLDPDDKRSTVIIKELEFDRDMNAGEAMVKKHPRDIKSIRPTSEPGTFMAVLYLVLGFVGILAVCVGLVWLMLMYLE